MGTLPAVASGLDAERLRSRALEGAAADVGGAPPHRRGFWFSAGHRGRGRASPSPCSCPCPSPSAPAVGRAASAAWGRAASGRRSWPEGWTSARASDWPPGEGWGSGRLWLRRGAPRSPSSGLLRLPVATALRPATGMDSESGSPAGARLALRAEPGGALLEEAARSASGKRTRRRLLQGADALRLLVAAGGRVAAADSRPRPRRAGGVASGVAVAATTPGRPPSRAPCPCLLPCRGGAGRGARGTGTRRGRRGWPESGPSG